MLQDTPKDESSLLKAVKNVHKMIDKELAAGINPSNVFVCGFSQGGLVLFLSRSPTRIDHCGIERSSALPLVSLILKTLVSGALTLASVLLYPKTLGGGAVFSGWVPFNSSLVEQFPPDAKRVLFKTNFDASYYSLGCRNLRSMC